MDQIISEIVAQEADTQVTETPTEEAVQEQEPKADAPKTEDVPFPKKAVNAISRRDKEIGKLRAQLQQLKAQTEAPKQQTTEKAGPPKEEDFQQFSDYLKASAIYEMRQELAKDKESSVKSQIQQHEAEWLEERSVTLATKAQEYAKTLPDYAEVAAENADIMNNLPEEIAKAFYEADDGALAFYNLAKEGKLEALATMSPYRAAMEIAKAERPVTQQISKAPRPMQGATGKGPSSSSLDTKSPDELMKWLNS